MPMDIADRTVFQSANIQFVLYPCRMIINFGSINIDHVYRVPHMPAPGETLAVLSYDKFLGGKGVNQSIAIAKSGGSVRHVGATGPDGEWVLEQLRLAGLDLQAIASVDAPTGHAIIMVDETGENQILICSGANAALSMEQIERELDQADPADDWVLLQNETNLMPEIVQCAKRWGLRVVYSAAPFVAEQTLPLLSSTDLLVVNELEAEALAAACGTSVAQIPVPEMIITRGAKGAVFTSADGQVEQAAFNVSPVDTTGAGDTILGAFLANYCAGADVPEALRFASAASALQITRPGAASAIPDKVDVDVFLKAQG